MLRPLKNRYNDPRLFAGKITTSGTNTVTKTVGGDDLSTATEASAGLPVLTLKQGFRRTPVFVGVPGTGATGGSYVEQAAASTNTVLSGRIRDGGGTAIDGAAHYLALGYNSPDTSACIPQRVLCSKRNSKIFFGKVTTAGVVSYGKSFFTVTRASQGVYTVLYKPAFGQTPIVLAQAIATSGVRGVVISSDTAAGCTVTFSDAAAAVQDADFYLIVVGSQMRDDHGLAFSELESAQRKPRVVVGQITYNAGVPSATINSEEFTSITDNGTGDATLNLAKPFATECCVIATGLGGRVLVHTGSASAPRLLATNAAGTAADPTSVDFILIGSDDSTDY